MCTEMWRPCENAAYLEEQDFFFFNGQTIVYRSHSNIAIIAINGPIYQDNIFSTSVLLSGLPFLLLMDCKNLTVYSFYWDCVTEASIQLCSNSGHPYSSLLMQFSWLWIWTFLLCLRGRQRKHFSKCLNFRPQKHLSSTTSSMAPWPGMRLRASAEWSTPTWPPWTTWTTRTSWSTRWPVMRHTAGSGFGKEGLGGGCGPMAEAARASPSGLRVNRTALTMNGVQRCLRRASGMTCRVEMKRVSCVMNVSEWHTVWKW